MIRTLVVAIAVTMNASSAVKIDKIAYKGWPNCYRISNGEVDLVVTTDAAVDPEFLQTALRARDLTSSST